MVSYDAAAVTDRLEELGKISDLALDNRTETRVNFTPVAAVSNRIRKVSSRGLAWITWTRSGRRSSTRSRLG